MSTADEVREADLALVREGCARRDAHDAAVALEDVRELWLSGKASALPSSALRCLTRLTCLRFDGNRCQVLLPEIGALRSLRFLSLESNLLERLPAEIGSLSQLTQLVLSRNRLRALPVEFNGLVALRRAWLGKNALTRLPRIVALRQLETLDLRDNSLRTLRTHMGERAFNGHEVPALRWLALDGNPSVAPESRRVSARVGERYRPPLIVRELFGVATAQRDEHICRAVEAAHPHGGE